MLKIAVVANCQARPIAFLLENALDNVQVITIAIVHLLKNEQAKEYEKHFEDADFVITQKIADSYPCEFIHTTKLRKVYGHKIIEIPNLFYRGYNPELRYYRIPEKGTLTGPLGDYHNELIFNCWAQGGTVTSALKALNDEDIWADKYSFVAEQSLLELSNREKELDIEVSDILQEKVDKKRLFYTFNHPCLEMLLEVVKRISVLLSRKLKLTFNTSNLAEPLNQFYVPISPHAARIIGFNLDNDTVVNCRGLKKNVHGQYSVRGFYSIPELIEEFFKNYDDNRKLIHAKLL